MAGHARTWNFSFVTMTMIATWAICVDVLSRFSCFLAECALDFGAQAVCSFTLLIAHLHWLQE